MTKPVWDMIIGKDWGKYRFNIIDIIDKNEVIGKAHPEGYQPVRFTRIKYKDSPPTTHINIRQFQRGYDDEGEEAFFPTKKGFNFPK